MEMRRLLHFASLERRYVSLKSAGKQNKEQEKLLRFKKLYALYTY